MSDLPHVFAGYIQVEETQFKAAVSEYTIQKIGQNQNAIVDSLNWKTAAFSGAGTYYWTPPASVSQCLVFGVGGGGGGGGVGSSGHDFAQGGYGCRGVWKIISVTGGASIPIIIGGGGAGASHFGNGSAGSNTYFNGTLVCNGAPGGVTIINTTATIPSSSSAFNVGGCNWNLFGLASDGVTTVSIPFTVPAGNSEGFAGGGYNGGGASSLANGGAGAVFGSGSAGSLGSGGGGGAGTNQNGGPGGDGYLAVYYLAGQ